MKLNLSYWKINNIYLKVQNDSKGISGDVRDITVICENMEYAIGFSLKHNHFAVKHSRLSHKLDFAFSWFGIHCSDTYWQEIYPIFDILKNLKKQNQLWKNIKNKESDIYLPLLNAFMKEIKYCNKIFPDLPVKMVEYLLGRYDFYKIVSVDREKFTQIQSFNLHGFLNRQHKIKAKITIPLVQLPTKLIEICLKENSYNTVEMYFNNGWQLSFRIHNASTKVEPSLKFDIKAIGVPSSIITINCLWE